MFTGLPPEPTQSASRTGRLAPRKTDSERARTALAAACSVHSDTVDPTTLDATACRALQVESHSSLGAAGVESSAGRWS